MRSLAFIEPGYGKWFRCTNAFSLHPMTFIPTSLHQEVKQGTHSPTASRPRLEFSPGLGLQNLSSAHCPLPTTHCPGQPKKTASRTGGQGALSMQR